MDQNLPNSQTPPTNPNLQAAGIPPLTVTKKPNIFLIIILLLLLILISGSIYYFFIFNKTFPSPKTITQTTKTTPPENLQDKQIYRDENWGFEALYPKTWYNFKSGTGDTIYFASYDGKENYAWYSPSSSELRIAVNIIPQEDVKETLSPTPEESEEQEGPIIGGEKSTEILTKKAFSAYEVNRYQANKIPQNQIDKGRSIITYKVLHNDFLYEISAEPSDSTLSASLRDFLNDFKFIQRKTYQARVGLLPSGTTFYEDLRLGFTFEYPDNLSFAFNNDLGTFTFKSNEPEASDSGYLKANVKLVDSAYKKEGNFEKDIMRYASLACAADGPGTSISCPEGSVYIETFTNKYNTKGYLIKRKKEITQGGKKTTVNEILYAFKLDAPDYFAILFETQDPKDQQVALDLADTFQYLKLKE